VRTIVSTFEQAQHAVFVCGSLEEKFSQCPHARVAGEVQRPQPLGGGGLQVLGTIVHEQGIGRGAAEPFEANSIDDRVRLATAHLARDHDRVDPCFEGARLESGR
jgi:hypothetical protein